jgi:hypothetical protein
MAQPSKKKQSGAGVIRYGVIEDSVGGYKAVLSRPQMLYEHGKKPRMIQDTECQWLLYNPKALRDGDIVKIIFKRIRTLTARERGKRKP